MDWRDDIKTEIKTIGFLAKGPNLGTAGQRLDTNNIEVPPSLPTLNCLINIFKTII